jgi:imidazole glycerol-phosphate synthase subunit HisH
MEITIVDYGMGNIHSLQKKVRQLGAIPVISSDLKVIAKADKIILPGVGHFGMAMENLKKLNLVEVLHETVIEKKVPVLGICLGMQLMATRSEEGAGQGLGWFDANVVRLNVYDPYKHKIPHTGWNTIHINHTENPLLRGIAPESEFYFMHIYQVLLNNPEEALCYTDYDNTFTSAICRENIYGVQFHPEKSHDVGQKLFQNFIQL